MEQKVKNIAVVSSNPENGFFSHLLWSMQEESLETMYDLEIYFMMSARNKGGPNYLYKKIADENKASAIITIADQMPVKFIKTFLEHGIIPVLVDARARGVHSINTNNKKGSYDAVKYLLETGKKRIGLIIGDYVTGDVQRERFEGYKQALEEKSVAFKESLVWNIKNYDYFAGKEGFRFMLSSDVDAVFCAAGDYVAHGFLNEARKQQVDIPGAMALIGFDDIEMSADTGLTTVKQPLDEMGKEAFRMATAAIENPGLPPQQKVFENTLIIRETA